MSIYVKEERRALMHEFQQTYERMKKKRPIEERRHFDVYGNNVIEVWEYKNGKKRSICRVREDGEAECYRKALEIMKLYNKIF